MGEVGFGLAENLRRFSSLVHACDVWKKNVFGD
jgi:hypothetical protein